MSKCTFYGVQQIVVYDEDRILKSSATGATNLNEINWLIESMIGFATEWKESGWGYICCIGDMTPVTEEESQALVELHKRIEEINCKGIAFVNPDAFLIGVQAAKHQKQSNASYLEKHFRTEEEARNWLISILD